MKVLYISAWYPSKKDQMMGLFVKKHADAVRAQGTDVKVLGYEDIPKDWRPDVIQLNVLSLKNAIRTYWLHRRYGVPYVIVEHWSRYLSQNLSFPKGLEGWLLRFVAKRASMILPVSENLMQAMQACGIKNDHWQVVHNVVDDFFYDRNSSNSTQSADVTRLLHVSCFDEKAKNVKGLLLAMEQLYRVRKDWHLTLVGTGVDYNEVREFAQDLEMPSSYLTWTGELTPYEVKQQFDRADIFVLFSNYENAPVVVSESLAAGCPVVATKVGGIPEMVPSECGVLVTSGVRHTMVQAIVHVMDHPEQYNPDVIRSYAEPYRATNVGNQLNRIYLSVLNNATGV